MTMKTILITGGAGMVGQNILEHSSIEKFNVLAPARKELDLLDGDAVRLYVSEHKPDIIIHAAGRVGGIQANIANPVDFLEQNVVLGRNILMAARDLGVSQFLNLASSCMYPREGENPLREETVLTGELEPTNEGYGLAKIFAMRLGQYINREEKAARFKTLIPCNLYGRHDTFTTNASHLIPAIIAKMHTAKQENKKTVEVWGDGKARREFMYAGDAADGIMRAIIEFETLPEIMNLGLGFDHSVNDYYQTAADILGWEGEFSHDLSKPAGMKQKLVSIERQTAWGWKAKTSLEDGIRHTHAFYSEGFAL